MGKLFRLKAVLTLAFLPKATGKQASHASPSTRSANSGSVSVIEDESSSYSDETLAQSSESHLSGRPSATILHACQPFRRKDKTQREHDVQRLAVAFTLLENANLKHYVTSMIKLANTEIKDKIIASKVAGLMELFGSFITEISDYSHVGHEPLSHEVIAARLSPIIQLENILAERGDLDDVQQNAANKLLSHLIRVVKDLHPQPENSVVYDQSNTEKRVTSVIEASITILDIVKDACDIVPPPCVKPIVALASGLIKAVKKTRVNHDGMRELSTATSEFVLSVSTFIVENNIALSEGLQDAFDDLTNALTDIVRSCMTLAERSLAARFLQQGKDGDTVAGLKSDLQKAIECFQMKAQILQSSDFKALTQVVWETAGVINDKMDCDIIAGLPTHEFFEGSRDDFIPEIHDDVLKRMAAWIDEPISPILWLCGSAGLGKSSISHQLVYHLIEAGRLGAQMFFTRGADMQQNMITVIHTLAREIASLHPKTIPKIASALRLGSSNHQELSSFLKKFILEPIQSLALAQPLVIILDALDECRNTSILLQALANITSFSGVKILMTSRPEPQIEKSMSTLGVQRLNLHRIPEAKIETYFSARFADMTWNDQHPSQEDVSDMAKLADGLIIWAATACNFLGNEMQEDEAYELLQKIISTNKSRDVTAEDKLTFLYHTTLSHLFKGRNIRSFHQVFQAMSVVQDSMTVEVFANTFGLGFRQTKAVHAALVSLEIYEAESDDTILPATQRFHTSFLEYVTHSDFLPRSHEFYINPITAHSLISKRCLSLLQDLTLSPGYHIPASYGDLDRSVQYAVCFWPFHTTQATPQEPPSPTTDSSLTDGMHHWTPFYLLASQALTAALEGISSTKAIDKAVMFHSRSLQLFAAAGLDQSMAFGDFGFALWKRYQQSGSPGDLEQSISMQATFLEKYPAPCRIRARALYRLGIAFRARFMAPTSPVDDLNNAIEALNEAFEIHSSMGTADFHTYTALGISLRTRFDKNGILDDLDRAISMNQLAIDMPNLEQFDRTQGLNNLATCLLTRYHETNTASSDLNQAIGILYEILETRPAGHPHRSSTLNNLACGLRKRYEISGAMDDLEEATGMLREVLDLRRAPHRYRAQSLVNLALCLRLRFEEHGSLADLDEAISKDSQALALRPAGTPFYATTANRLGCDFLARFQHTGAEADINEAVLLLAAAVDSCPHPDREHPAFLGNLADALRSRFEHNGAQQDLAAAVEAHTRAVALCVVGSADSLAVLNGLGSTLLVQYEQTESDALLGRITYVTQDALRLQAKLHYRRFQCLNNRAKALHYETQQKHEHTGIDEVCDLYSESLFLCPPGHPSRQVALQGLAHAIHCRFEQNTSHDDLNRCIALLQELFALISPSDTRHRKSSSLLRDALRTRFKYTRNPQDVEEAILIPPFNKDIAGTFQ